MTKKTDTTTLVLAGALLAAVAVGASLLLRRPGVQGSTSTYNPNFWDKSDTFSVHNGLAYAGYGLNVNPAYDGSNSLFLPVPTPLAPRPGGYYGVPLYQQIANQYTSPPATSSPTTAPSGYTLPGSTGSTGTGFGVSTGSYYR